MYELKQALALLVANALPAMLNDKYDTTMKPILYTKDNCPKCDILKRELKQDGVDYDEINVGRDITREDFIAKFPQIKHMPYLLMP
jgi:glutaredoxin